MANIQVKNVPDELHRELREHARQTNQTLGEVVLRAVEQELARSRFRAELAKRPETHLGISAAELLEEARGLREEEFSE